jgi:hypothetical protein
MTVESHDNGDEGEAQPNLERYEVGYGKPPAAHRFKKGRSGNPLGRPRKRNPAKKSEGLGVGSLANLYLLEEAYRPVLVREGERTIELPAIKAVFRAMSVAAMKGNRFAQRTLAELVQAVEAEDRRMELDYIETLMTYKCNWEAHIARARELGRPEPQPIPHPDDIIADFRTGDVRVCGPATKEEKVKWDRLLEARDDAQEQLSYFAAMYRRSRNPERKAFALDMWKLEQRMYDKLNDNLPARYRKELEDRCWEEGASRAGQQRRIEWLGE